MQDAPPAPWSPFPLVELTILIGIVLVVVGFIGVADRRGLFIACGVTLIYLATLELSLREHFSGFRSHSTLLAAVAGILPAVPLYFLTALPYEALTAISLVVGVLAFLGLRAAFRRRTGGIGFRA